MIRISHFVSRSFVDGPGERAVLFMQGCPIGCQGCQNIKLWDAQGGRIEPEDIVATTLAQLAGSHGNITISGGDPFSQPFALERLLIELRKFENVKHIIVYTGFLYDHLVKFVDTTFEALKYIDVLVDGPFIKDMDDPLITYRGSRNQRPIDVQASLAAGKVITLDWDSPEIVIASDGSAFLPVGLAGEFSEVGKVKNTRRCGQTTRD